MVTFFAASFAGSESAEILTGETTKDITFVTNDDNIDESDGSFTISLTSGTSYTLGSTANITVNVSDNDIPVISIADASSVVEGTDSHAVFTLTANILPLNSLTINYNVSGDVEYIPSGQRQQTTAILSFTLNSAIGNYTASLNIPIDDDEVEESDGVITVTLLADDSTP